MQKCEKVPLKKNLRKSILRGHPWIYREALGEHRQLKTPQIVKVTEGPKGDFLAWAIYDPTSVLALRILSTAQFFPNSKFIEGRIQRALQIRTPILNERTNSLRLVNGEGDGLPGLIVDKYNSILVIQYDGEGMQDFWSQRSEILNGLVSLLNPEGIVHKHRNSQGSPLEILYGKLSGSLNENLNSHPNGNLNENFKDRSNNNINPKVLIKENDLYFYVDIEKGQKTGFFFDQRENREHLSHYSKNKRVLNLFSYTGGFSIYSGRGGSSEVTSVDISQEALTLAQESWKQNEFHPSKHQTQKEDVFSFLQDYKESWDLVIVDPPSLTHSEKTKVTASHKYIETFSMAAKRVAQDGDLIISSCSSHINFEEFYNILSESLSKARRSGQILRISGQGPDHPFPHACPELRYLKFIHCKLS